MLAAGPLALIVVAIVGFAVLGGPGLGERRGPPVEELAVERTVLRPGEIELSLRNTGPDPVQVSQVSVADVFVDFRAEPAGEVGRLEEQTVTLDFPWQEGSPYAVSLLTSTGATIDHEIDVAVETPEADAGFFGLMALLGTYVGVIPVALGMLFLPFVRRVPPSWIRVVLAATIGLLAFLAVDAYLEGTELGQESGGAFGGVELLFLGAGLAYLALAGLDAHLRSRHADAKAGGASGWRLALMIAVGIGLHNLGEGLAIGSAYAVGALALGAFLVIGFAIHNTTEGLAIVAPLAAGERPSLGRLAALGLIAGGPAILGAFVGASVSNPELSTFLLG
ncbi:MAG: ZIP family metal transporter, partial [Solirubrobacterales bacterium]